jgi:hypothetical protein
MAGEYSASPGVGPQLGPKASIAGSLRTSVNWRRPCPLEGDSTNPTADPTRVPSTAPVIGNVPRASSVLTNAQRCRPECLAISLHRGAIRWAPL